MGEQPRGDKSSGRRSPEKNRGSALNSGAEPHPGADEKDRRVKGPPAPAPPASEGDLPHALTFFLSVSQRRAVLRALSPYKQTRAVALLRALGIEPTETD